MPCYEQIVTSGRCALNIRRYHTWPGMRVQTVAEHTAHMMRIYWCIFGPMPSEVSTHILWHDAGEIQAGDGQFQAKRKYPELKVILDKIEDDTLYKIIQTEAEGKAGAADMTVLSRERVRIKATDLIEGFEFSAEELAQGNLYALPPARAYFHALKDLTARMTYVGDDIECEEDAKLVWSYLAQPYGTFLLSVYGRQE
jgi:5'-deoxynucleotidase YfbR-like HD superfamily hydrolase